MHISVIARVSVDKVAIIDAESGETVTFGQLDQQSNRTAHLLRSHGLRRGDRVAFMLENGLEMFAIVFAALRIGLYVTPISTRLKPDEVAYLLKDSGSRVFFAGASLGGVAAKALDETTGLHGYAVGGPIDGFASFEEGVAAMPPTPVDDETTGIVFPYSSGSTGRPKGIVRTLPIERLDEFTYGEKVMGAIWSFGADTVYLHPAPLYHAAPLQYVLAVLAHGGTFVLMRSFDPETALAAIERFGVTHSQWVPTMFNRMLRLPEEGRARYDLSSLRAAIHAAAPCPVDTKRRMIDWWGPILYEFYGASEANGMCFATSEDWLRKPGTVGRAVMGELHIVGEDGEEVAPGVPGTVYFGGGMTFEYHNDPAKTRGARHPLGWTTVGDAGFVDKDGYLFLTDRVDFMIISGGVNIYPAEAENILISHPRVIDVAVIGVPHADFGEEVKAIVQPTDMVDATPVLEAELIRHCRDRLADVKCPRSVDFVEELPRLPTGKLQKKLLRAPYWAGTAKGVV